MLNRSVVVCGLLLQFMVAPSSRAQDVYTLASTPTEAPGNPASADTAPRPLVAVLVRRLYAAEGNASVWLGAERGLAEQALALLRGASAHGLSPAHYRSDELAQRLDRLPASEFGRLDADLSGAVLQLLTDIHFGRTAPVAAAPTGVPAPTRFDPVEALRRALRDKRLADAAERAQPRIPLYRRVKLLLAQYRLLASQPQQGLPLAPLPGSRKVVAGDGYEGAAALRRRLRLLGDLVSGEAMGNERLYSTELAQAVKRFQFRHGLVEDGELGTATMKALTVPLGHRVRQLELTLERLRWAPALRPGRVVVVNLPAFRLWAFDTAGPARRPALEMRVIVGKAAGTPTPLFVGQMRYLEFQPYWNVPNSIVRGEILPNLTRDPAYLQAHDMELVGADGQILHADPPGELAALRAGEARVRQRSGARNVLGAVKFAIPNRLNIYLHSTSARELFGRTRRDLSHGCIRVERPAELAEFVLDDPVRWNAQRVREAMAPGATQTAHLRRPVPVVLFYATAIADRHGMALFADDIYHRDAKLMAAMDQP